MSYRRFTDSEGCSWEAWEVRPALVERRLSDERRGSQRASHDRRKVGHTRLVVPRELRAGWLALEADEKRLRVAPIPDGWVHLSDDELERLTARAAIVSDFTH
jgi:hypothetical protein